MNIDKKGKEKLRKRLEEAIKAKSGFIVICNVDKGRITDFYQGICVTCIIEEVASAVVGFNKIFGLPGHQEHEKIRQNKKGRQKRSRMD